MDLRITDEKLQKSIDRFFEKLEQYFPEHKVFALDSIDKDLREKLSGLYKKAGCATAEEFLAAYGFRIISGEEVKKIRSFVLYTPGNEPEIIKGKVDNMVRRLQEYYPDKKIPRGLQSDHKNLSKSVSGLYQWLGYENMAEMLTAYGFDVQYSDSGRPANDHQSLIAMLQEKYKAGNRPKSVGLLIHDNPEYAGQIKTLQNKAGELFGMSLAKYLKEIGVVGSAGAAAPAPVEKKKTYHYFMVSVEGQDQLIPCATDTRTVREGDYIEMCGLRDNQKTIGVVLQTCYHTLEEDLPCPTDEMQQYIRKLTKSELKEIEAAKVQYIYCSVRLHDHYGCLYYISPFDDIEVGDVVMVPYGWYGSMEGIVVRIECVSEKTAPFPVKRTKKIERVLMKAAAERLKAAASVDALAKNGGVRAYVPPVIDAAVTEKYEQMTYFSSAVFRGLETDVQAALRAMYPASRDILSHRENLCEGISQFECADSMVPKILRDYPNLKAVFFAEDWKENAVYLAYSESGCPTVTSLRLIGNCDFYSRDRWSLIHDPTEDRFSLEAIQYEFAEKAQWETCDYVFPDGKTQLAGFTVIPSKPYKKHTTKDPCEIIKICYPNE